MCENALVNLNVFSGESFFTSVDIFEKTLLLFLSVRVFFDSNLNFSTILKKILPSWSFITLPRKVPNNLKSSLKSF